MVVLVVSAHLFKFFLFKTSLAQIRLNIICYFLVKKVRASSMFVVNLISPTKRVFFRNSLKIGQQQTTTKQLQQNAIRLRNRAHPDGPLGLTGPLRSL